MRWKPSNLHRASAALLALAVLLTALLLVSQAWAEMLSVSTDELNFRAGPSQQHDILFVADRFFPVRVLEKRGKWIYIEDFEGDRAWAASWLLSEHPAVIISVDQANVRQDPSTKAQVVEKVVRGVAFRVMQRSGEWIQVGDQEGIVGWVHHTVVWGESG